jgi:hypothetical protein
MDGKEDSTPAKKSNKGGNKKNEKNYAFPWLGKVIRP